tara:strand:- start:937 stop:1305 length:369 start_codon:yes stop_codon:yes gene_type:complete
MLLKYLLIILGVVSLIFVYNSYTTIENFYNYSNINSINSNYLLHDVYPVNRNDVLNYKTYRENSLNSNTNLGKYNWKTPNNGSCLLNEMCGGLYNEKIFNNNNFNPAPLYAKTRVNAYIHNN